MRSPSKQRDPGIANGYRSGLEDANAQWLASLGVQVHFEDPDAVIRYTKPTTPHRYTPDFRLPNGIIIETKGRFTTADRQKHLLVKQQHPHLDIRFVFSRSSARLSKVSKTTYAMWCQKHGFQYADKLIPEAWVKEQPKCP